MEGSFQRLTVDAASTSVAAVDTTAAPLYPGWVLLEEEAYSDASENGTTAEARMITGHTVKVTFFLADPPAVSSFCVHGPELKHDQGFRLAARVLFSEKHLVLLHFEFTRWPHSTVVLVRELPPAQYFVYRAAAHGRPSCTKEPDVPDAWMIRTCFRYVSWNLWCKGHATLHVDDILVNEPSYYMILPELWDFGAAKFTLRNMTAVCPTLSIHGGDLVYLALKVGDYGDEAWVVGVDLRKKTVEVLEPAGRSSLRFLACTFSGYLNATPRSCAPEDGCGQSCPLNRYLRSGNIITNNRIVGDYSRSSIEHGKDVHPVNSYLFQPQFVVRPHILPQTMQHNFTPSGPGYVGHLWRLMPMDSRFQPQMPEKSASPAVPFNKQMPQVPMGDRFLSQMPPVLTSLAMPFNTLMARVPMDDCFLRQMPPVVPMDDRFLSQRPPVPAYPAVHHS